MNRYPTRQRTEVERREIAARIIDLRDRCGLGWAVINRRAGFGYGDPHEIHELYDKYKGGVDAR